MPDYRWRHPWRYWLSLPDPDETASEHFKRSITLLLTDGLAERLYAAIMAADEVKGAPDA